MNANPEHIHLREYIERIMDERQSVLELTAKNLERRLDALNELRSEVVKDRAQYLSRAVFEQIQSATTLRIEKMEQLQAKLIGVSITLIALSGIAGTLIGYLARK